MYAHKGRTKKLKHHGFHGFALDQPSRNGFGPINRQKKWNGRKRSETVGNGRKRSETVGNGRKRSETVGKMIRLKLVQPDFFKINISAQRSFFFEGPKVSKGKRLETVGDRTFARQKSSCFVAYGLIPTLHGFQMTAASPLQLCWDGRWPGAAKWPSSWRPWWPLEAFRCFPWCSSTSSGRPDEGSRMKDWWRIDEGLMKDWWRIDEGCFYCLPPYARFYEAH